MTNGIIHLEYDDFCQRFLSCPTRISRTKRTRQNPFKALQNADDMSSQELSRVFLEAVNSQGLIPDFLAHAFEATWEDGKEGPHIAVFRRERERELPRWTDQIVPIEFTHPAIGADPFDLTEGWCDDEDLKDIQALSLKRISTTVERLFAAQHRVAVFMLFVIGRKFRFTRWDRAGVIVTPAIDYFENHTVLCHLLWRISRLDAAGLGFDISATRILPGTPDFLQMDCAARQNADDLDHTERDLEVGEIGGPFVFEYARSLFRASLAVDWPRYQLEISSDAGTRFFLVGKPAFIADGVSGRGTRGYVALDVLTGRFVWLKDVWRMSYLAVDREGDVLRRLNLAGIEGVPTLVSHGDVLEQVTVTSNWASPLSMSTSPRHSPSSSPRHSALLQDQNPSDVTMRGPLHQHAHYRIVVDEVCLPLDNIANGKQLVSLVWDALRAHHQAATNPQTCLLHCDVSGGNIMIYPMVKHDGFGEASLVWAGILSDWELSKPVDDQNAPPITTQAHRLGTYQFMSVNLLQEPSRPVQVSDELESFFHVLVYHAVRHLRSTCVHPSSWIVDYFNRYAGPQQLGACGLKSTAIETRGRLETLSPPGPLLFLSPLDKLLSAALRSFTAHYKVMEYDRQQACAPPLPFSHRPLMDPARKRLRQRNYHVDEEVRALLRAELAEGATRDPVEQGPTADERDLAARLVDHTFMLAHLEKFLQDPHWSDDDRIPPPPPRACPAEAQPIANAAPKLNANPEASKMGKRPRHAESSGDGDRTAKRQRTSKLKPTSKAPVPALPSTHAMRTRSQTRRDRVGPGAQAR